jgi:hypothetical protein
MCPILENYGNLSQDSLFAIEENCKNLSQDNLFPIEGNDGNFSHAPLRNTMKTLVSIVCTPLRKITVLRRTANVPSKITCAGAIEESYENSHP